MIRSFLSKLIGFLIHPIETFQQMKESKGAEAIAHFLSLLVFNAIISAIITALMVTDKLPFVTPFLAGTVVVVLGLLGFLIVGLVLHVAVVLLGGQRGIIRTLIILSYSLTPFLLTSWLLIIFSGFGPFGIYRDSILFLYVIGIGIYTIILVTIGIRELQCISQTRAFIAAGATAFVVVVGGLIIAVLLFAISWGIGYLPLVPYFFNMERNGEILTLKNTGGKGLADLTEIKVEVNGVPRGRIGIASGSIVSVNAPSCPSHVKFIGVFENGTNRELWTSSDDECPNTIVNITVIKIGDVVTVRNNGGPGLDRVAALNVQIYNGVPYPLGLTPNDQVTIEDRSCSTLVVVNATLKSGAYWQLVHEYLPNCTALQRETTSQKTSRPTLSTPTTLIQPGITIAIRNGRFEPNYTFAVIGTSSQTVRWVNEDDVSHQIVSDALDLQLTFDRSEHYNEGTLFKSGVMGKGGMFRFTVPQIGNYNYHCALHPSERGVIIGVSM